LKVGLAVLLGFSPIGCGRSGAPADQAAGAGSSGSAAVVAGKVRVDGSSTVLPVAQKMAEVFRKSNPSVEVGVSESGTGGGFKKLCAGEIDIAGASRPINAPEMEDCKSHGIEFIELPIGFDSLTVVVNPKNTFVDCLKVQELKTMWEPGAERKVTRWKQVRPSFPDEPLALFGPSKAHGTFDYFTLAVVGTQSSSRGDYTASEDGTALANGVASDPTALGYFGFAYYVAHKDKLKLVGIDSGKGCITPSAEAVLDHSYEPLSRPLFVYVSKTAAARPEVRAMAQSFVSPEAPAMIREIGYVPLPAATVLSASRRLGENLAGSRFGGQGSVLGVTAESFQDEDRIKSALVQ
jgi:phosphate transport system substrate-binding protein